MIARTKSLIGGERKFVTWRITGTETPNDPLIEPATWRTEPFDLYVDAP